MRGPTPAAPKRLMQGVLAACAVAAVAAPVAGAATLTNFHPPAAAGTAAYEDAAGASNVLSLGADPAGTITVTDSTPLEAVTGGLDGEETCLEDLPAPPTDPPADPATPAAWTCTLADRFNVKLGVGNDTVNVGDNLPPLDIDGGDGSDTVNFGSGTGTKTVDLAAGTATGEGTDTLVDVVDLIGSRHTDDLTGTTGDDHIRGLDGSDVVHAGEGDDNVGAGNDGGDDVHLYGGPGNDFLYGYVGDDFVYGGSGDDFLDGSLGFDTAYGGPGGDDCLQFEVLHGCDP